jgi:Fe-S cluster assembly protein SufD
MNTVAVTKNSTFTLNQNTENMYLYTIADGVNTNVHAHVSKKNEAVHNIFNYSFVLGEQSTLNFFVYIYDIDDAEISVTIHARGRGARAVCRGLYMLEKSEHVRIHIMQEHSASAATTDVLFKGIVTDAAQSFFKGTIVVHEQGKKAHAALYNKNILLSSLAKAVAMPQLEVVPHDVQCKHGSATSQLDQQHVLYAQSRGLDVRTAQTILLESFAADCIKEIDAPLVHSKVRAITKKI